MNHRQLRIFQFQLLCLNRIYLWSFLDEDINTKQHLFWMHNFGEEQDGTFLNVFFHYFRDGVPPYFTCLVSDGAVFCSSDIMQCVHPTQRTVLNRALASQSRWVRSIFDQFYSIIWLLSVCIGMTAFNFVSSLLMCSHYAQFNMRLRSFLRAGLSMKHPRMGWSIFQAIHFFWKKMRLESVWICLARQVCDNQCRHWCYRHIL